VQSKPPHNASHAVSEKVLRSFLEEGPYAVIIANDDGEMLVVNAQVENLFGYPRTELLGQQVELLVPERYRHKHRQHRADYFKNPKARAIESGLDLQGRRKDGSEFPIEISLNPMQDQEGILVLTSICDVTERRKTEEQRFRLAAIVESSDDAIIGKTLDGTITSWNEGAHRILGYTFDEVAGKPSSLLVPDSCQTEEVEILRKLASGEHVAPFDTVRTRKDGASIAVSVTISPVRDSRNNLVGASTIVRDITHRRHIEEELARAKETAEAASQALESFSYSVAHDLRAPLRGINGFAQLLLKTKHDKLDTEGQDWLQEIVLNASKMGQLIDALLSLGRLTKNELHCESVDLSSMVRATAARLMAQDPERVVALIVEDQLAAQLDPVLARVFIENLISNAWKFTSKVPLARIEFGQIKQDGMVTFFVRDNGAGFDMTFAKKLFGPFQRLHTVEEFAGTGVGLATAQRIALRHRGRIWAEGAVNLGATFHFAFPDQTLGAPQ